MLAVRICLVGLLALVPGLTGCADRTCEELCEERDEECSDSIDESSCKDACEALEDFDDCKGELDEMVACMNDMDDICEESSCQITTTDSGSQVILCTGDCDSEAQDLFQCIADQCRQNPVPECGPYAGE